MGGDARVIPVCGRPEGLSTGQVVDRAVRHVIGEVRIVIETARKPSYLVASESFALDRGGIARVGRMIARAMRENAADAALLSLNDARIDPALGPTLAAAGGNRMKFVLANWRAGFGYSHAHYTHLGISRAHPRFPGMPMKSVPWMMGAEVWDDVRPDYIAAARKAHALVSISHYTRDRAVRADPTFARAAICWLCTEQDELPAAAPREGPPSVAIVSRLDPDGYKGHQELIAAWPDVMGSVSDARLLIVGQGEDEPRLRRLVAASPAKDQIDFLGFVPEDRMPEIWRRAHVFAMPSRKEGFGLVYVEAMRFGVPVIASTHDAGQEINVDGLTGFNVSLDAGAGALGSRLVELLVNHDLRSRMGEAARARWQEHFRFSAFRARLAQVLATHGSL